MKNLVLICLGLFACCEAQKLKIEIMYESLCPDSLRFIQEQVYPVYPEIARYVDIKFIPFGKSSNLGDGKSFKCQHGPEECFGNLLQSCTLHALKHNQNAQVNYVNCFMREFGYYDFGEDSIPCLHEAGVSSNYVQYCAETFGSQLQLKAEADTKRVRPRFVPTIVYNGVFDQQDQDASLRDFKGVVCSFISEIHPGACRGRSSILI